jgi:DNA ligase D
VGQAVELVVADRTVSVTNPDKVFFPTLGATKLDLIEYYRSMEVPVMRAMRDRPVMLQRFPDGVEGNSFFQKRMPATAPDWLTTMVVRTPYGTPSNALVIADLAHLVWAVNLGCIGFHSWPIRSTDPQHCDELRIDLDPSPGTNFAMAREAALETRRLLEEHGLRAFVKTSGGRGIHVYVRLLPSWTSLSVRAAAVAVARELERRRPELITASWWKEERGARVFVDFNQNAPHKTVFAPWSVRARPCAAVSCALDWDDLATADPDQLTIHTVPARIRTHGDPWADIDAHAGSLESLLEMARRDRDAGLPDAPWPPEYPKMPGEATRVAPSRARRRNG